MSIVDSDNTNEKVDWSADQTGAVPVAGAGCDVGNESGDDGDTESTDHHHPAVAEGVPDSLPAPNVQTVGDQRLHIRYQRWELALLGLGVIVLFWKMHGFKLPSQIVVEQLQTLNRMRADKQQTLLPVPRVYFWNSVADWLQPWKWGRGDLLKNTTPTGGDYGAHVWAPDVVKRTLIPKGRVTGWSNEWFAGMPVLGFYFPLPLLSIVGLSYVLPYGIAFKLVSVIGICSLPFSCYACGRMAGLGTARIALPRTPEVTSTAWSPTPLFMGLGSFVFLLGRNYDLFIYGGGILPTMAGEFSFSIGLSFAVLFLGSLTRLLRKGTGRRVTALLLACTGLSHLLPTIWALTVALALIAVWMIVSPRYDRRAILRSVVFVFPLSAALAAWWLLPFAANLDYTNDMGWEKSTRYLEFLFPFTAKHRPGDSQFIAIAFGLAIYGFLRALITLWRSSRRSFVHAHEDASRTDGDLFVVVLSLITCGAGLLFRFSPQYRLWNARILPFWFLAVILVAAYGVTHLPRFSIRQKVCGLTGGLIMGLGIQLGLMPGWLPIPRLSGSMIGVQQARRSGDRNLMTIWTGHNFAGYEAQPGWPEYHALMEEASRVGASHGCGRVMWEHEEVRFATYGTTLSPMLLPYWTNGCMGSIDGVYFESSATLPAHWITATLVSAPTKNGPNGEQIYSGATDPQRNLPYPQFAADTTLVQRRREAMLTGLRQMRQAGVRFFLTATNETQQIARELATDFLEVGHSGPYTFFRVLGNELVSPLTYEPVVVNGIDGAQDGGWLDTHMAAFVNPEKFPEVMVANGPKSWQRAKVSVNKPVGISTYGVGTSITNSNTRSLPALRITNIKQNSVEISFDVDRVGVPVAVNTSYFPNWIAHGAQGPYRSMPNYMIVVPTKRHVHITYGYSMADRVGWLLFLIGVAVTTWPIIRKVKRVINIRRLVS
jgi:hypothetical protein